MKKRYKIWPHIFILTCSCLFFSNYIFPSPCLTADITIIVNKDVPDEVLSKEDIKQIFLGKKKKWKDNTPITVVLGKTGEAQMVLLMNYVERTPSQFNNVWKRLVFTGEASFPRSFSDDKKIIEFVASKKGAIGYVTAGGFSNSIKVIRTE